MLKDLRNPPFLTRTPLHAHVKRQAGRQADKSPPLSLPFTKTMLFYPLLTEWLIRYRFGQLNTEGSYDWFDYMPDTYRDLRLSSGKITLLSQVCWQTINIFHARPTRFESNALTVWHFTQLISREPNEKGAKVSLLFGFQILKFIFLLICAISWSRAHATEHN